MQIILALIQVAQARTWTVDADGGGDAATVEEGVALLSDGDTLRIGAGVFDVMDVTVDVDNVHISGAGAEMTTLTAIDVDDVDTVQALVLRGRNITVSDMTFSGYGDLDPSTSLVLSVNDETVVERCHFTNNATAIRVAEGALFSVSIFDSVFVNNLGAVYIPDFVGSLVVENNLFLDSGWGVYFSGLYSAGRFDLISVVNNTFVGDEWAVQIGNATYGYAGIGATKVEIVNNVFADVEYSWMVDLHDGYLPRGEIRNNVYTPGSTSSLDEGSPIVESHNLEADVSFVAWSDDGDWTNDDLHVVEGSAAIDIGVDGYATSPADADGYARPIDGDGDGLALPDAGAYELCPTGDCPLAEIDSDTGDTGDTGAHDTGDTGAHDTGSSPTGTDESGEHDSADPDSSADPEALATTGCGATGCASADPRGLAGPALAALAALGLRRRLRR